MPTRRKPYSGDESRPWLTTLFLAAGFVVALFVHMAVDRVMIKDEAIELLQAADLKVDQIRFFAPAYRHPDNSGVMPIEALVPYVNHLFIEMFGYKTGPMRFFNAYCYGITVMVFFLAMRRFSDVNAALFNTFLFLFSSYGLIYNQFLTRNALSPLWGCLLFWALAVYHTGRTELERWRAAVLFMPLALLLGNWTYTSFKIIAVATIFAITITYAADRFWEWREKKKFWTIEGGLLFTGVGLFITALGSILWVTRTPLPLYFMRGDYVMVKENEWYHILMTFLAPIYYCDNAKAIFLPDETHPALGRSILPVWIAALFYIGLFSAFLLRGRLWRLWFTLAWIWIISSGILGLGGASQKYLLALLPINFALASYGLHRVFNAVKDSTIMQWPVSRWAAFFGLVALVFYYPFSEINWALYRKREVGGNFYYVANEIALRTGKAARRESERAHSVYVYCVWGKEVCFWAARPAANIVDVASAVRFAQAADRGQLPDPKNSVLILNAFNGKKENEEIAQIARRAGIATVHMVPYATPRGTVD